MNPLGKVPSSAPVVAMMERGPGAALLATANCAVSVVALHQHQRGSSEREIHTARNDSTIHEQRLVEIHFPSSGSQDCCHTCGSAS